MQYINPKIIKIDTSNRCVISKKNVYNYDKIIISCGTGIFKLLDTNFLEKNKKQCLKQNLEIITGAWGTIDYKKKKEPKVYYDSDVFYHIHENKYRQYF